MVEFLRGDKREPAAAAPCTLDDNGVFRMLFVIVVESFIGPQKLKKFSQLFRRRKARQPRG
jgi:hypothetical protein